MIAVQKPPALFSPPALRPSHSRHPSAPVVVRPSQVPGVFTLSKAAFQPPRPQQTYATSRPPRSSARAKPQQKSPQPAPAPAAKQTPAVKPQTTPPAAADKPPRGRQQNKPPKGRAAGRNTSVSNPPTSARRPAHQPSPPPARIPSPVEGSKLPHDVPLAKLGDPFLFEAFSERKAPSPELPLKAQQPKLASQPSGRLARRRLAGTQSTESPSPKARAHRNDKPQDEALPRLEFARRSAPAPVRPHARRASTGPLTLPSFPICDDSSDFGDESDVTPPATPIRESASVPAKGNPKGTTWQQQSFRDDGLRTAPLSSTFGFPFTGTSPCSTPSPPQRRRNHQRVPSEGVFAMSTDEESSTPSPPDLFESRRRRPFAGLPRSRSQTEPLGSPTLSRAQAAERQMSSSAPAQGYFAGSVFQNSPAPDDLPAPSFAI